MTTTSQARDVGILGKDGRTSAMCAKCAESPSRPRLWAMSEARIPSLVESCQGRVYVGDLKDTSDILGWAAEVRPELVLVGPEEPLSAGAVDVLTRQLGVPCFGPTRALARIEWSKSWTRHLVARHGIPGNPDYQVFSGGDGLAAHMAALGDFVVKPDGLTGGKGVKVYPEHFDSFEGAVDYAEDLLAADGLVVVEERLDGEEFSLQTITDGITAVHCPLVQDHKRAFEGDMGPNTGGMGTYSCTDFSLPFLHPEEVRQAQEINERVIEALYRETGEHYRGVLYGGFMATASGVRLIEYNCRFGDPEALNVLPLMASDFVEVARAVATGQLDRVDVRFQPQATVCKYIVPAGYPSGKGAGDSIHVPPSLLDDPSVRVYWAACDQTEAGVRMTGSRAVGVVGIGDSLEEAEGNAERAANQVEGDVRFRHDIGTPELVACHVEHMAGLRQA